MRYVRLLPHRGHGEVSDGTQGRTPVLRPRLGTFRRLRRARAASARDAGRRRRRRPERRPRGAGGLCHCAGHGSDRMRAAHRRQASDGDRSGDARTHRNRSCGGSRCLGGDRGRSVIRKTVSGRIIRCNGGVASNRRGGCLRRAAGILRKVETVILDEANSSVDEVLHSVAKRDVPMGDSAAPRRSPRLPQSWHRTTLHGSPASPTTSTADTRSPLPSSPSSRPRGRRVHGALASAPMARSTETDWGQRQLAPNSQHGPSGVTEATDRWSPR